MITLSIVSGTYNRRPHLINMINSARLALPAGINYEFVIVDAGSDDGSLDWLRQQPDVKLIEHGERRGAIVAFTEGANQARGKYVVMANDDVVFHPFSITKAIRYLEDTPTCGAVAFQDNRPAPGYNGAYKVQFMNAVAPDGSGCGVVYAQVGMYRRWLGDLVGWWGASDPIMGQAKTYGGDNYLSAKIWETGYTVDEVPGIAVTDNVVLDAMRTENSTFTGGMHPDSEKYLECFPEGPRIGSDSTLNYGNLDKRQLRILYLPIYEPGHELQRQTKRGLRQALKKVGLVYEVDYLNGTDDIAQIIQAWKPDLMISQYQDGRNVNAGQLGYWRTLHPAMSVINWHGDARGHDDPAYLALLKYVDLQLVVNAAALEGYQKHGIKAAYWQIGFEETSNELPEMPKHDVLFLGNAYSDERQAIEKALRDLPDLDVGLYGSGWQRASGNTLYDFDAGEALYANCKIAIGDTFPGQAAFVSNRLLQGMAAGAFMLQQAVPELEHFTGLVEGRHYIAWDDLEDLQKKIIYWTGSKQNAKRRRIARAGQKFVRENFSFDAQVKKLFTDLLPMIAEDASVSINA